MPLESFPGTITEFFAIPKSVIFMYPLSSSKRFSGFKSRCIIFFECKYFNPIIIQAIKNSNYIYN